jgi:ribosomal protein L10
MAFGTSEDNQPYTNSHLMGNLIKGQVGLLFTNQAHSKIQAFFKDVKVSQFANPGQISIATVEL